MDSTCEPIDEANSCCLHYPLRMTFLAQWSPNSKTSSVPPHLFPLITAQFRISYQSHSEVIPHETSTLNNYRSSEKVHTEELSSLK
ncbi:hypothetical protein CDAR_239901 [Caerostris darwini]|uniref:Uncharacterized protein n=1 Tax=Caerostris darwini TaxID=1538125 RepID=A0AAV4R268_9ARAC|nr:hypothetical protein CDAR_239901 [Caerostris darwini]